MKKVLIAGISGLVGGLLRIHLEKLDGYELSGLDRRRTEGVKCLQADISDFDAIRPAFAGQEVVVHLAAQPRSEPWDGLLNDNLIGAYNVYEAAREAGVRRVVFASSAATVAGWRRVAPYNAIAEGRFSDAPGSWAAIPRDAVPPGDLYGATKVWGEALGRYYSDAHGMSVLRVRIGSVSADDRPRSPGHRSRHLSRRDACQVLRRCIDAPERFSYDIFFATSDNRWGYHDLAHTREVLGYEPQDSAEALMEV